MLSKSEIFGFQPSEKFKKPVAYFSMEFAVDQSLKIYSGGLGFLAGSHMKSAYTLKQNLVGIGMLWKYGYYDQVREIDGTMKVAYIQKRYFFLTDTKIVFPVIVHGATVYVKALLLKPEVFNTAPIFLLTTDIEQNDALSRTITHNLYDANESTRIAQSIVLGIGGAKLLDILEMTPDIYHLNEGHALPLCFYLYAKFKDKEEVRRHLVFTTHTPEEAGNESHDFSLLSKMSFFNGLEDEEVKSIVSIEKGRLNYTLTALQFAKIANGVSKLHGKVSREMWAGYNEICEITHITNSQNKNYWKDNKLEASLENNDDIALILRKKELKRALFKIVADQTGKLFDEHVLTIVWARRFAGYKRADLIMRDMNQFIAMMADKHMPIQMIWAGKPYPLDHNAIITFNQIFKNTLDMPNVAVLTGYELELSAALKRGSDLWLNNPRLFREASGTSGMTASMNGSVNFSIPDGWIPEFAKHGHNSFLIEPADRSLPIDQQDDIEANNIYKVLKHEILPLYYNAPEHWIQIVKNSMREIIPGFSSDYMAQAYYEQLFMREVKNLASI